MSPKSSNSQKPVRVIVVDDHPLVADRVANVLCDEGHVAIAVYSAVEALRLAPDFGPQALISDVWMPRINGFELARAFAAQFPVCRVLLMSVDPRLENDEDVGAAVKLVRKTSLMDELFEFIANCGPDGSGQG
jgi:DNA-binding NarL/FixJ family response regulator